MSWKGVGEGVAEAPDAIQRELDALLLQCRVETKVRCSFYPPLFFPFPISTLTDATPHQKVNEELRKRLEAARELYLREKEKGLLLATQIKQARHRTSTLMRQNAEAEVIDDATISFSFMKLEYI